MLILIKPLPFSFTMFYLPKGPILDYTNKELFNFFFENLKKLAKQKHCVFIKFDPGIVIRELSLHKEVLNAHTDTQSILADIKAIGGIHKGFTTYIEETVQPRFHMGLYPCELKEHLPSSTLRSIKKAQKKNVVVEEAGVQGLDEFAQIMHMTEERKQVHLRGKDYFELLLRTYPKNAHLFLAYVDPKQKMQTLLEKKKQLEDIIAERPNKKKEHELLQTNEEIDCWVKELAIATPNPANAASTLSGGNQQRIVLAKWLACRPQILVLNGPTVGVDIGSKHDIHAILQSLAGKGMAVIIISDDLPELLENC